MRDFEEKNNWLGMGTRGRGEGSDMETLKHSDGIADI